MYCTGIACVVVEESEFIVLLSEHCLWKLWSRFPIQGLQLLSTKKSMLSSGQDHHTKLIEPCLSVQLCSQTFYLERLARSILKLLVDWVADPKNRYEDVTWELTHNVILFFPPASLTMGIKTASTVWPAPSPSWTCISNVKLSPWHLPQ